MVRANGFPAAKEIREENAPLWPGWFSGWWRADGTEPWRLIAVEQTEGDCRREMRESADADGEFLLREPGLPDPNEVKVSRSRAKPKRAAVKQKHFTALLSEQEAKDLAAADGMQLEIFYANGDAAAKRVPHWQFRGSDGRILLHWWPSKGSYWDGARGRGKCARAWQALAIARSLIGVRA